MKDKLIKAALSFAVVCVLGACTKNYLDINSNPYEVDKEQMEAKDYAIASGLSAMFGTVVSTDVNTAQFTDCLLGSTQGGYYADANNGWTNTISKYNPTDNWTNVFMYSDKVIPQLYSNMSNVEGISEDPLVLAILKIVKVCVLNRVTDTYGPIPYSEIGSTGKIQVAYDDQPKVYSQMFDELDEAIALLDENIDRSITSTTDQVFDGTAVKWCRFANSMKLRLAMRVVYTDFVSSKGLSPQQLGEQAVAHSVGVMQSNADNAQLSSLAFGKDGNPLYTACMYNSPAGSVTGGDSHAAADIICYMNGYEDPRREKYFSKAQFSGDNALEYVGMRRGIAIPALSTVGLLYSGVNFVDGMATPLQWMNAAEVAFLKAEAVGGCSAGTWVAALRPSTSRASASRSNSGVLRASTNTLSAPLFRNPTPTPTAVRPPILHSSPSWGWLGTTAPRRRRCRSASSSRSGSPTSILATRRGLISAVQAFRT